jgi:hypothetical protein
MDVTPTDSIKVLATVPGLGLQLVGLVLPLRDEKFVCHNYMMERTTTGLDNSRMDEPYPTVQ